MAAKKKSPVKKPKVAEEPPKEAVPAGPPAGRPGRQEEITVEHDATISEPPAEEASAPRQVVEVVEEEVPVGEPLEQTSSPAEDIEEPTIKEALKEEMREEVKKEMVDELFDQPASPVLPEISVHKKSALPPLVIWVLVVVGAAVVTGGVLYAVIRRPAVSLPFITAEPTSTPTPTPTPSPAPAKREDVTIQVLNGGGTPGAAGKMKKLLEEKGYTVGDTGNTDEYTYDKTEILVKSGKEAYSLLLEEDLKDSYTLGSTSATLSGDSSYDVQIIVGKE